MELKALLAQPGRPHPGEAREPQPDRVDQGPDGAVAHRGRRAHGGDPAGRHDHGAHPGQHRHLAGHDLPRPRLQAGRRDAGERDAGAAPAADALRRRDHPHRRRVGLERRRRGRYSNQCDSSGRILSTH